MGKNHRTGHIAGLQSAQTVGNGKETSLGMEQVVVFVALADLTRIGFCGKVHPVPEEPLTCRSETGLRFAVHNTSKEGEISADRESLLGGPGHPLGTDFLLDRIGTGLSGFRHRKGQGVFPGPVGSDC
jgi:hypothetical protein